MAEGLLDASAMLGCVGGVSSSGVGGGGGGGGGGQKTKRLRTSFKHHQLRMLKSYFATNHNPDAKDLKQLSQKTTLSKRVLQVWFQNARAKWRRLVQKQESAGGNNNNTTTNNNNSSNCSHSTNDATSPLTSYGGSYTPALNAGVHGADDAVISRSSFSLYDDMSLSGSSSVASAGFPSPL